MSFPRPPLFFRTACWLGLACATLAAGVGAKEPPNLNPIKDQVRAYVDSGEYDRDITVVAKQASAWLEQRAKEGGTSLTVVFDLDETLLSNWDLISRQDFGYLPGTWNAWVAQAKAPAIDAVREVYLTALRLKLDVIFLTGRRERDRADTEKNLKSVNCAEYAALIFKPDDSKETTGAFKVGQRRKLQEAGRVIIANIGDQESDLAGGYAERTFKLPDPFYLTK